MSLFGNTLTIDGVRCGMVMRGGNGEYLAVFERKIASLEQIEGINWSKPVLNGESVLPAGYGFDVADISYCHSDGTYKVRLKVAAQYLGDVTGYQAQVAELQDQLAQTEQELASATEQAEALSAENDALKATLTGTEANADQPTGENVQTEAEAEAGAAPLEDEAGGGTLEE